MKYESDGNTNCNWCIRNDSQRLGGGASRLGNQRASGDHQNYICLVDIDQNTEKSLGDMRRLPVTQTQVKDHQVTLVLFNAKSIFYK